MNRMSLGAVRNGAVSTALIMLAIFLTMTLISLSFPPKARLMPMIIGVAGSVLGLIQVILEIRAASNLEAAGDEDAGEDPREELKMVGWTLLYFFGILCFGFMYAAPVLVFGFLYLGKSESLKISIGSAIATWAVLLGFFETWLGIPLFEGLVLEWLLG